MMNDECECQLCEMIKQTTWISVKDSPPKIDEHVWVYFPTDDRGSFFEAIFYGNKWDILADTYPNSSNYKDFNPTYWMPLPKPPENENE